MQVIIKPPKGWEKPKDAQMVVNHFAKYGATLKLTEEDGKVKQGVFSLPDSVDEEDKAEVRRVAKVNDLVRMYMWEVAK